jgi:hypothetical protein
VILQFLYPGVEVPSDSEEVINVAGCFIKVIDTDKMEEHNYDHNEHTKHRLEFESLITKSVLPRV